MTARTHSKTVIVIGGGNIGSHAAALIARNKTVGCMILIDPGCFSASNLVSQNILPSDVGVPKVAAIAALLKSIRPDLEVRQYAEPVAAVPLGDLRGDVIVCCVDSRIARQYANEIAWRLGIRWIDTGVDGDGWLVRIAVYVPGKELACLECEWSDDDYELLETGYPCQEGPESYATHATAELGALAGSLAAAEVRKILDGDDQCSLGGRQLLIDVRHHRQYLANMQFFRECRFNHDTWVIETLARGAQHLSVADALALGSGDGDAALVQEGQSFVSRLTCVSCGWCSDTGWTLSGRFGRWQRHCQLCGGQVLPTALDQEAELKAELLTEPWLSSSLARLGYRTGDVFSVKTEQRVEHFLLEV